MNVGGASLLTTGAGSAGGLKVGGASLLISGTGFIGGLKVGGATGVDFFSFMVRFGISGIVGFSSSTSGSTFGSSGSGSFSTGSSLTASICPFSPPAIAFLMALALSKNSLAILSSPNSIENFAIASKLPAAFSILPAMSASWASSTILSLSINGLISGDT